MHGAARRNERGELDRVTIPAQPLDVLAQQVVAEVAAREWPERDLFDRKFASSCCRRCSPEQS